MKLRAETRAAIAASRAAGRVLDRWFGRAYWERQAHPWDVAAGALLVREAGGRVTGGAGQPFDLDEPTIIASNGRSHRRMVAYLTGRGVPTREAR
jgi:fructose-1,6-bisphosphatase/inositol monophosphatase family enzyme